MSAAAFAERLNPVLVKDVRQALRGRLFRVVFALNLSLAMVASLGGLAVIADEPDPTDAGRTVFLAVHAIYALCAMVLVPLLANRSMAAERDDLGMDALVLSGLGSSRIVRGKWLGACVLLGLFLSSSLPFLALGYTLYGLDVAVSLVIVLFTTVAGVGLCLAAILFACLARNRTLDALVLGLQLVAGTFLAWAWIMMSTGMLAGFGFGGAPDLEEFLVAAVIMLAVLAAVIAWFFSLAVDAIAHEEENSSTRQRITALIVSGTFVLGCAVWWIVEGADDDVLVLAGLFLVLLAIMHVPLVTERDELGRRMRLEVRGPRWKLPFAWVLAPGGGRGLALWVAQLAMFLLLGLVPLTTPGLSGADDGYYGLLAMALVSTVFLGLPSWINSLKPRTKAQRQRWRILMVLLPFGVMIVSMLLGVLTGSGDMAMGQSVLNPFYVVVVAYHDGPGGDADGGLLVYGALAVFSVIVNLPRVLHGRQEVQDPDADAPRAVTIEEPTPDDDGRRA